MRKTIISTITKNNRENSDNLEINESNDSKL